ncbi:adenylate/guanylate cyclase domain-containing protein [Lyngbya confervoides]|uniref:Adenylate cyclase n=1 Tax=Lyngbya confervoides BDU141951 TaxID=1574623 RepID=A0ABD4T728_9CYAN|nr:adenylate/guanylate cyclase domain-containing protein [Lyngbya confervoides]MCM1984344.1 adenylate/guanylate cyclase domain-containing protein [Lyngbya confervoides BDU141951]
MRQSWWRCFSSRLSKRIVRSAFLSIVLLELFLFIPSYIFRERELFRSLETDSLTTLLTLRGTLATPPPEEDNANPESSTLNPPSNASTQDRRLLAALKQQVETKEVIAGAALYRANGQFLGDFGAREDIPEVDQEILRRNRLFTAKYRVQERYDIVWPAERFNNQYIVAFRLRTLEIRRAMVNYTLQRLAMVLAVSAFVSLVLLTRLQKILITPILQFRDDLTAAGQAAGQEDTPLFYTFYQTRQDELGDVAVAFCQMYHQVRQEIRDRRRAEAALIGEQEKSERLLLNILPGAIARRLKEDPAALASRFDEVTILFADIVGFTELASQMKPLELLTQLNGIFSAFDKLAEHYGLEKIKTIGDAYMIVGGIPTPRPDHAIAVLEMAIEMLAVMQDFHQPDGKPYQLRIGINTGPVIAGVIGRKKFSYDLWGDAVNIASRMESHGLSNHIQVTPVTYERLKHLYEFEKRTGLVIKNVGTMDTYLYKGRKVVETASKVQSAPVA